MICLLFVVFVLEKKRIISIVKKKTFWSYSLKYLGAFLAGAFLLSAFSMLQKKMLGLVFSLAPRAFLIPILFGGFSGLALSVVYIRLRASRERMRDFLNNIDDIVQIVDKDGNFVFVNQSWHKTLGYSRAEAKELKVFDIVEPTHLEKCKFFFCEIFSSGEEAKDYETVFLSKSGEKIYLEGRINCRFEKGEAVSTRTIFRDISEKRKAREFQKVVSSIFEKTQEGVAITDAERSVTFINHAFTTITGYTEKQALGMHIHELIRDSGNDLSLTNMMRNALRENEYWHGELWTKRKNNERYPLEITINAITNTESEITNYACVFSDISKRKDDEMRLNHLATHDMLTNLLNRETFYRRAKASILEAEKKDTNFAILFLDLDGFKYVNDQYGHYAGDTLLQLIAQRLNHGTRKDDILARFGGDEFAVLLNSINSLDDAKKRAEGILCKLEAPYNFGDISVQITASIGISLHTKDVQINEMLMEADKAMYAAKRLGKNRACFIEQ